MNAKPSWLSRSEADAWLRLVAVAELLPTALDTQLQRDADLTFFEYFSLAQLAEAPDQSLRISDLAAQTNATVARLSRVVSGLESDGLVERLPDESDGRGRRARLTGAGIAKLADAAPGHVATVRRLFADVVRPEEMSHVQSALTRVLEVLDPQGRVMAQTLAGLRGRQGLSREPS